MQARVVLVATAYKFGGLQMVILAVATTAFAQMDQLKGSSIWIMSSVTASRDSAPTRSGEFRQSLGAGLNKWFSKSWMFSASLWTMATETRQAATAEVEGHIGGTWRHKFNQAWYLHAGTTIEFASDSRYPYLNQRVEIGRKLRFNNHPTAPFLSCEAAYRTDGGYADSLRLGVGFRIRVRSQIEIIPMYSRRNGMNGATLMLRYDFRSPRRSFLQNQ